MRRSLLAAALWGGMTSTAAAQLSESPEAYLRASDLYDSILGASDMDDLLMRRRATVDEAPPTAVTSESVTAAAPFSASPEAAPAWLEGVDLPELPVRWHRRLVELLTACRDDPGTNAVVRSLHARSNRYAPMIRRKLRDAGLPEDLLFVAMVESGFTPSIRSPAGAVGLWQFVKTTGKEYGLNVTPFIDERMHAERSTEAAIAFFKDLHGRLGSWDLSLAAFNMGYGGILRSVRKYNTNDFWRLTDLEAALPHETVNYVTKVLAYAVVGRNPERFGLTNVTPAPFEDVAMLEVPPGVTLDRLARGTGLDGALLASLNPQLLKGRIPTDADGWHVRVPADRRDELVQRLVRMDAPPHRTYVMRFGEQLDDVAAMFGSSVAALRRLNKLTPADTLGVGFLVLVPDVDPKPAPETAPPVVTVPDLTVVVPHRRQVFHSASGRETCSEIASFFGVSLDELRTWNHIDTSAALQSGMVLQLFVDEELDLSRAMVLLPEQVRAIELGSDDFFAFHEGQRDRVRVRYRIKRGDTLDKLAERFELSVGSIFRINQFGRERELQVDDEIVLYVPTESAQRYNLDSATAQN